MPSDDVGTTVLVTGATGFIGRHVVAVLHERGYRVIAVSRRAMSGFDQSPTRLRNLVIDDFTSGAAWDAALSGVDVVIHIAGLAHLPRATQRDFLRFESDNVAVSRELAAAAVRKSVRRMVFLSSAGVHGASTAGRPFCSSDPVRPYDAYTESKASAERIVQQISSGSTTEWVVVRAPMVIGRNSPGNFSRLASLVGRRVPLPFANIDNRRSVISVWNLCDFLVIAATHASAANMAWLVSDGRAVSTTELIREIGAAIGVDPSLFFLPRSILRSSAALVGRSREMHRLLESFELDIQASRDKLGWSPPVTFVEGVRRALRDAPRVAA